MHSQTADSFDPRADGYVYALALQTDGKIVAGGAFYTLAGQVRPRLGRLNADGTLDGPFDPGSSFPYVYSLAVQPDGKTLVGGEFTYLGGENRTNIGRLNANGTPDSAFLSSSDYPVNSIALQPDGKILVGGYFTNLNGSARRCIGRLQANGTLDSTFDPGASSSVFALALEPDGKILVGGTFTNLAGQPRNRIGRLNPNGTLDFTFNPINADGLIQCIALQPDGKIMVGGLFKVMGGQNRTNIARLNSDGSADLSFNPGASGFVYSIALQADGKVLAAGGFTVLAGQTRSRIGRLNPDGTLDTTFNPGANSSVGGLAIQPDGKVLVGGNFSTLGGQIRTNIGRLNNNITVTQNFFFNTTTVTWLRSGSSPEVWRTTFDVSTNGNDWISLGAGQRISGGWRLTGLSLPANARVRARGFFHGGLYNGSSSIMESFVGPPTITTPPASRTNNAGTLATFTVMAGGTAALNYQWRKDGTNLSDGGTISGTRTPMLILSNAFGGNSGSYTVIVSNSLGAVTSAVAALTIRDPFIGAQPTNQSANAGQNVSLNLTAFGSNPLSYQWYKDGVRMTDGLTVFGATTAMLTLNNVRGTNQGAYFAVIGNTFGNVTSLVANLQIADPVIGTQPSNRTANAGGAAVFSTSAIGTSLQYQWRKNAVDIMGAVSNSLTLAGVDEGDSGRYDVVVKSSYGSVTSIVAALMVNYTSLDSLNPGASGGGVSCLAVQPDGKILIGGFFTTLGGQSRSQIARVNRDGTLDSSFNPGADNDVKCLAVQADGKILVGGEFTALAGQSRKYIGRLNPDGSLDSSFNPVMSQYDYVYCLLVQSDSKILVGGDFSSLGGQPAEGLGRLNVDGSVDANFNIGVSSGMVKTLAVQPDGKILVGGVIYTLGGESRYNLGRLNSNGRVDSTFAPNADGWVHCVRVQPDGKILVAGEFPELNHRIRNRIGRLNPDGSLDTLFDPNADGAVYSCLLQADGKILLGGMFGTVGGWPRNNICRLNPDGNPDTTFSPTINGSVGSIALQADGKVVMVGGFTTIEAQSRIRVGRLNNTAPAEEDLSFRGSTIEWLRGGTSPEIWSARFDSSTNGIDWSFLGLGTRMEGGWRLAEVAVPSNLLLRARGFLLSGGSSGDSSYFVETSREIMPSLMLANFGFRTNRFEFNISGSAGRALLVESSTNLKDWNALATNSSGLGTVSDPAATNFPHRFYRARTQ